VSSEALATVGNCNSDGERARALLRGALNPHSALRREHAPEQLIAAAQVYAILATCDR
jgi:hypothetical protein